MNLPIALVLSLALLSPSALSQRDVAESQESAASVASTSHFIPDIDPIDVDLTVEATPGTAFMPPTEFIFEGWFPAKKTGKFYMVIDGVKVLKGTWHHHGAGGMHQTVIRKGGKTVLRLKDFGGSKKTGDLVDPFPGEDGDFSGGHWRIP